MRLREFADENLIHINIKIKQINEMKTVNRVKELNWVENHMKQMNEENHKKQV